MNHNRNPELISMKIKVSPKFGEAPFSHDGILNFSAIRCGIALTAALLHYPGLLVFSARLDLGCKFADWGSLTILRSSSSLSKPICARSPGRCSHDSLIGH
jgi:hypothetical protein